MGCASILRLVVTAIVTLSAALPVSGVAAPLPLNGPLVSGGDVTSDFQFTPDGSRIVYVANQDLSTRLELYSVASGGGTAERISGAMVAGGNVLAGSGQFSPNGDHYFYIADQDTDQQFELYRTSTVGGQSAKLNGPLTSIGDVDTNFRISADGTRVAYVANAVTNDFGVVIYELFGVPSTGGDAVTLNAPLVVGGDVVLGSVRFAPSGDRAYYVADQETDDRFELYGVSSLGGEPTKLNVALPHEGDVESQFWITSDGANVVYIAAEQTDFFGSPIYEIFSAPSAGGQSTRLNDPFVLGGDVVAGSARISPDGGRVIYLADARSNDVVELFGVSVTGGTVVPLNLPLPINGDISPVGLQFAAGGDCVIYGGDQLADNVVELFSVPTLGGEPVRLNNELQPQGDVDLASVVVSPDGSRVLFRADQNADEVFELYAALVTGGEAVQLSAPLVPGGDVMQARFSPDGRQVVYLADQETDDVFELFLVGIEGGTPKKINDTLTAGGDVTHWQFSPSGEYIAYRADQDENDVFQLYSVALAAPSVLAGDFNLDGVVNAADYTVWRNNLGDATEDNIHHAGDGGGVDGSDYEMWKRHYGTGGAGAGGVSRPVPEPTTPTTCAVLGFLLSWNVRHRRRQACLRYLV